MKTIIILRGASGSGKSTYADFLKTNIEDCVECCADNFFYDTFGNYCYNGNNLKQAHEMCMRDFENAIRKEVDCIIVSNTNTKIWEFEKYEKLGKENGYRIFHIIMENRHNTENIHGVPLSTVENQRKNIFRSIKL